MTRHILYRAYSQHGTLLYVGRTANPGQRLRKHAERREFWDEVASVTLDHFRSGDALAKAEKRAIEDESPVYNIHYNPRRDEATEAYRRNIVLLEELYGEEELYGWDEADEDNPDCWVIEEYEAAPEPGPEEMAEGQEAAAIIGRILRGQRSA